MDPKARWGHIDMRLTRLGSHVVMWPKEAYGCIWGMPKIGILQNGWFIVENPIKIRLTRMIWGYQSWHTVNWYEGEISWFVHANANVASTSMLKLIGGTRRGTGSAFLARSSNNSSVASLIRHDLAEGGSLVPVKQSRKEAASAVGHHSFVPIYIRFTVSPPSSVFQLRWIYHISLFHPLQISDVQIEIVFWDVVQSWSTTAEHKARRLGAKSSRCVVHSAKLFWVA